MELGNYISEQLAMFLRAILLGGTLGLIYDLLRTLRRLGGRVWGGVLDGFFCVLAVSGLFLFTMAGDGELRLFVLMGALGGGVLFFCLLSRPMRPLWDFWLELLLAPAELVWRTGKKCGRRTKKSFSFCRKWVTMKGKHWRERLRPPRQEGDEEMNRAPVKEKKKAQPRQEKKRPSGKLTLLILAALLAGIGVQLYSLYGQMQAARAEEAVYAQRLAELEETNRRLQEDVDNSGSLALIENIARDARGWVSEGDKIFLFGKYTAPERRGDLPAPLLFLISCPQKF